MILIAGSLTYPPGGLERLKDDMSRMVEASRHEDGCMEYTFAVDVLDPTRLVICERWRDQKALDEHRVSAHMADWRQAGAAVGPVERDLSVWEVGEGRRL